MEPVSFTQKSNESKRESETAKSNDIKLAICERGHAKREPPYIRLVYREPYATKGGDAIRGGGSQVAANAGGHRMPFHGTRNTEYPF